MNYFNEGGRPPSLPPGQQLSPNIAERPTAQVVIREIPRPAMITVPYYMAVVAEPARQGATFNIEVFPGAQPLLIGPPVLYIFASSLGICARKAMQEASMWGWNPQPHPNSVIDIQQALQAPPPRPGSEPPFSVFLDHIKLLLSGALEDVNVPPHMRLQGKSGRPYIPCGTGVGHNSPGVGEPCPAGPCHLNGGGDCVWAQQNLTPERAAELKTATVAWRGQKQQRLAAMQQGQPVQPGRPMQIPAPPGAMAPAPAAGAGPRPGHPMPGMHPQPMPMQPMHPGQLMHPGQRAGQPMPMQPMPMQPMYPGQPMPMHPGVHPGQPMLMHPGVHPGQPMPMHPGVHPGQPMPMHPGMHRDPQGGAWGSPIPIPHVPHAESNGAGEFGPPAPTQVQTEVPDPKRDELGRFAKKKGKKAPSKSGPSST